MKDENKVELYYQQKVDENKLEVEKIIGKQKKILFVRVVAFLFALTSLFIFDFWQNIVIAFFSFSVFTIAVNLDLRLKRTLKYHEQVLNVLRKELGVSINHSCFFEKVDDVKLSGHNYASDLDIFGENSLFHFIDRTITRFGSQALIDWLKFPSGQFVVEQRQAAVKEISRKPNYIMDFIARTRPQKLTVDVSKIVQEFQKQKFSFGRFALTMFCAVVNFYSLFLFFSDAISFGVLMVVVFLNGTVVYGFLWKRQIKTVRNMEINTKELNQYVGLISLVENGNFEGAFLREMKRQLIISGETVSNRIYKLSVYNKRFEYRMNLIFHLFVNYIIYFDVVQLLCFDKWIKKNSTQIPDWFNTLGNFEALVCFANLAFKFPKWTFPKVEDKGVTLILENVGHPLIPKDKNVVNDFRTELEANFQIITGSNMAGKSTFLRTVGINVVLALAGAPVCATNAVVPFVILFSSMRIKDSLIESISTFQAELERVTKVLDLSEKPEKLFVLFDEPLRGTNSEDRFYGVSALIKQLIKNKISGIVATHDLRLTSAFHGLSKSVSNFHFDISVVGQEYTFDYKLKEGVCSTFNASMLLKKIGLELDKEEAVEKDNKVQ